MGWLFGNKKKENDISDRAGNELNCKTQIDSYTKCIKKKGNYSKHCIKKMDLVQKCFINKISK